MQLASTLHDAIDRYNVLRGPTQNLTQYAKSHRDLYKVALLANHLFRAAAATAFMHILPFSFPTSVGICLGGSLFYRLTVENNCSHKFALPAFASSLAFQSGKTAIAHVINGIAFQSLQTFGNTLLTLLPLSLCAAYTILTVSYDVDHRA